MQKRHPTNQTVRLQMDEDTAYDLLYKILSVFALKHAFFADAGKRAGLAPAVEIPHRKHRVGVRRPHAEHAPIPLAVRAEVAICPVVCPLMKQIKRGIAVFSHTRLPTDFSHSICRAAAP